MKEVVYSDQAPHPVGPYSQAIVDGRLVFCSGQIGLDPVSNSLVDLGVGDQTRQCLANLEAILSATGLTMATVVKTTIFMVDISDLDEVNRAYGLFFPLDPPARSTVGVKALPKGAKVEVEAIAVRD